MLSGDLLDEPALFVVPSPSCEDALSTLEVTHNLVFHHTLLALAGGGIGGLVGGAEAAVGRAAEEGQAECRSHRLTSSAASSYSAFLAFSRSARGRRPSLTSSEVAPRPSVHRRLSPSGDRVLGIESQQTA